MREFKCPACKSNDVAIEFYKKGKEWKGNVSTPFTKTKYEGYYVTTVVDDYFFCECKRCKNTFREALKIEDDK